MQSACSDGMSVKNAWNTKSSFCDQFTDSDSARVVSVTISEGCGFRLALVSSYMSFEIFTRERYINAVSDWRSHEVMVMTHSIVAMVWIVCDGYVDRIVIPKRLSISSVPYSFGISEVDKL